MTDLKITEAGTAQFPMVRHAAEIGWTPLAPQEALALRGGTSGMLFSRHTGDGAAPVQSVDDPRHQPQRYGTAGSIAAHD